jgi:hypothetical protein
MSNETGECGKCESEISVTADRCPECGYEPADQGVLTGIASLLALGAALIGGLFLLGAIVAGATGGYTIGTFILAIVLIGSFTLAPVAYLYGVYVKTTLTAVNDEPELPFGS